MKKWKNYIGLQITELWVTRMHSSRMRTACLLTVSCSSWGRGSAQPRPALEGRPPWRQTSLFECRPLWMQNPLGQTSPWRQNPSMDADALDGDLLEADLPPEAGPRGCKRPWMQNHPDANHLPVNRMTHRCKNITLSQTLFAGGNNLHNILNVFPISPKSIETMLVPFIYVLIFSSSQ